MSGNIKEQLCNGINKCSCFLLQLTNVSDTAQLLIFIPMVFKDFTLKEKLLGMISLKERTWGVDISNAFENLLNDLKVLIFKLVSITTNGAVAIISCINGFIALCENKDKFSTFLSYTGVHI